MRCDVGYEKQKCIAIRPEKVPGLGPASVHYISELTENANMGVKSERKDFLEKPDKTKLIDKVRIRFYLMLALLELLQNLLIIY